MARIAGGSSDIERKVERKVREPQVANDPPWSYIIDDDRKQDAPIEILDDEDDDVTVFKRRRSNGTDFELTNFGFTQPRDTKICRMTRDELYDYLDQQHIGAVGVRPRVKVNVLNPNAGQVTLTSSAPVRLDSFFNGLEGLTSMTDLAGFRYELKRSCLFKPRLALADLHAEDTPNKSTVAVKSRQEWVRSSKLWICWVNPFDVTVLDRHKFGSLSPSYDFRHKDTRQSPTNIS
ncbi:hypothetical protein D6C95_07432 [Aureobasidium pullulans]|nr:hypothetical protein D6C95_07432 [Aureobasidium pullulans]